jgi:hypothetical protein
VGDEFPGVVGLSQLFSHGEAMEFSVTVAVQLHGEGQDGFLDWEDRTSFSSHGTKNRKV